MYVDVCMRETERKRDERKENRKEERMKRKTKVQKDFKARSSQKHEQGSEASVANAECPQS